MVVGGCFMSLLSSGVCAGMKVCMSLGMICVRPDSSQNWCRGS